MENKIVMVEIDYDYMDIIGLFPNMFRAIQYCKEKHIKPQYYTFYEVVNEDDVKIIETPYFCDWDDCYDVDDLKTYNSTKYCPNHYDDRVGYRSYILGDEIV